MSLAVKILIAGGFGVGKATLVGSVSEIDPLRTEERLSDRSVGIDDLSGVAQKTTTTVAMDFGRITLRNGLVLYLFGTPGQDRFHFMWDELALGALGVVVLADTRKLGDCFTYIDYIERRRLPFILALNRFDGAIEHDIDDIRAATDIERHTPVIMCDVRRRESSKQALITLVEHVLTTKTQTPIATP